MMKRIMAILLVLLMCLPCVTAGAQEGQLGYDRIVEMALHMKELATGDYLQMMNVPDDLQQIAADWAAGIDENPRLVVSCDVMSSSMIRTAEAEFILEKDDNILLEVRSNALSEALTSIFYYSALDGGISDNSFETIMDVNELLDATMLYASPEELPLSLYFVLYDNAAPIMLLCNSENGAVALEGFFVPSDRLAKCENHGQVAFWLMVNGATMTCSEVLPE